MIGSIDMIVETTMASQANGSDMGDSLLVQLLKSGLLGEVATDPDRLGYATQASEVFGNFLSNDGAVFIPAALFTALDEKGDGAAEILDRAAAELLELWPMMTNAFDGKRPTELLRAVLLQAVFDAAESSDALAVAVWMLMRNSVDLGVSVGAWQPVVEQALWKLNVTVANRLAAKWSDLGGGVSRLRMPEIEPISEAADPVFTAIDAFDEAISTLQPAQAHTVVGTHLQEVLAEIRTQMSVSLSASNVARTDQLVGLRDELGKRLRASLNAQTAMIETARLQQRLLWWRLSGHSQLAETRYCDIDDELERVVSAVIDLTHITPPDTPVAVEYLLIDLLGAVGTSKQLNVSGFGSIAERLGESSNAMQPPLLLVEAIRRNEIGKSPVTSDEISWEVAASVMFRELQVERLLAQVVTAKGAK